MNRRQFPVCLTMLALLVIAGTAQAQVGPGESNDPQSGFSFITGDHTQPVPAALKDQSKIEQKLNAQLPLDAYFADDQGQPVQLSKYFTAGRPVVLQLGYFDCPMLCGLISQKVVEGLNQMTLTPGKDFQFVYVSIDPTEHWELARDKKKSYLASYNQAQAGQEGIHLLTGKQDQIERVAKAVGFSYARVGTDAAHQYIHPGALIILTPDGHVARYLSLTDNQMSPQTLRLSLVEASNGKIGTLGDILFLTCFHYDGTVGKYSFFAINLMRYGGVLTLSILGFFLARAWMRDSRSRRGFDPAPPDNSGPQQNS